MRSLPGMVAPAVLHRVTVSVAVSQYLAQVRRTVAGGALSPVTEANYTRDLSEFIRLAGSTTVLDDVSAEQLDDIFVAYASQPDGRFTRNAKQPDRSGGRSVGRGPGATARFRQSVNRLFAVAERRGWVALNPMPDTTVRPKAHGVANAARLAPTAATAQAMLAQTTRREPSGALGRYLAIRDEAILALLFEVGLRVSELCRLSWPDLTDRDGSTWLYVRRGKGGRPRHVPVSPATAARLERLRTVQPFGTDADSEAMFRTRSGRRMQPRAVQYLFTKVANGLPDGLRRHVTPHAARHAAATLLLSSGAADVRTVQAILGHASLSTTGVYLDVATDRTVRAVAGHPVTALEC